MPMAERPLYLIRNFDLAQHFHTPNLRRRAHMLQQRLCTTKAVNTHDFFMVKRTVWLAKLYMALVWNLTEPIIVSHPDLLQIAAQCLFTLNRFKQRLKIAF